jgi:hypothetical protein
MSERDLHIISFDIPFPANYGGVIDVFYKIRALHEAGVKIHLHCFTYNREPAPELEKYCTEIHYYPRKTGWLSAVTPLPYIVFSRRSEKLLNNLLLDNFPILFEGIHTCFYLSDRRLRQRFKIYRESNIEHQYYYHLFKAERRLFPKIYFLFSGLKLRMYQKRLTHSSLILTVSKEDNAYLSSRFRNVKVEYLPSFHPDDQVNIIPGVGNYILYHGNLSVPENIRAVEYLITRVFGGSSLELVVAGMNPPHELVKMTGEYANVKLVPNPSEEEMTLLIREAHINVMVTFQPTGLKLKILSALFNGRFCLVNRNMVAGTELGQLCEITDDPESMIRKAAELMSQPFTEEMIRERSAVLLNWHSNKKNCKNLLDLLSL